MPIFHPERHRTQHIGWLRAAVLGANDGIVSTASLVVGVAASHATHSAVLVAGVAGLVAGAMSMAAGEYVSVSSQSDTERADIERERTELAGNENYERKELAALYVKRGLELSLANQVAEQHLIRSKPRRPRFTRASDAQIRQRVDRLAHQKSYLRVRSFEFSHSVIESLTQTRVVMLLNVISFEQRLNFIRQRL